MAEISYRRHRFPPVIIQLRSGSICGLQAVGVHKKQKVASS
jgi:hypothetical protein